MTPQEIQSLAHELMTAHGLTAKGWGFAFHNRRRAFGTCNYRRQVIALSLPVSRINSDADIIDTIKHEIAHALTPGADHGPVWKLQAIMIGARPQTCAGQHVNQPVGRWQASCACKTVIYRYRAPKPHARYACRICRTEIFWQDTRMRLFVDRP
jgi:predicted SprT family Zn-dependent metalloprotease